MDPRNTQRPRVVILGGGFAGLWAARALASAPDMNWAVAYWTHQRSARIILESGNPSSSALAPQTEGRSV